MLRAMDASRRHPQKCRLYTVKASGQRPEFHRINAPPAQARVWVHFFMSARSFLLAGLGVLRSFSGLKTGLGEVLAQLNS